MNLFPGGGRYAGLYNIDFGIKKGDKVVDIGAGNKPYPQATHVIDMVDTNEQRHGKNMSVGDRVFMEGDVCKVLQGVDDNYFDFCYSSHTFEHIDNLARAVDLISAKCKRGYYALPASDFEFFTTEKHFGHVNLCRLIGDVLYISKRPQNTVVRDFSTVFSGISSGNKVFHDLFQNKYRHVWEARHYWEGEIKYQECDAADIYPQVRFFK